MCCLGSSRPLTLWLVKQGLGTKVQFCSLRGLAGTEQSDTQPAASLLLHPQGPGEQVHGPPPSGPLLAVEPTSLEGLSHWATT